MSHKTEFKKELNINVKYQLLKNINGIFLAVEKQVVHPPTEKQVVQVEGTTATQVVQPTVAQTAVVQPTTVVAPTTVVQQPVTTSRVVTNPVIPQTVGTPLTYSTVIPGPST